MKGESHKAEVYDDLVPQLLDRVRVGAMTMTQVVAGLDTHPDTTFTIARIERDREAAANRFLRDRDTHALEQAMAHLDGKEAAAPATSKVVSAAEAVAWLHDLPALWTAANDSGRRLLTEALFEKVEVLGVQSVTIHPTPEADAHGWSEAFGSVPLLPNAGRAFSTDGRGERVSASETDLIAPVAWPFPVTDVGLSGRRRWAMSRPADPLRWIGPRGRPSVVLHRRAFARVAGQPEDR